MPQRSKPFVRRAEPGDAQVLATLGRALNIQQGDPSTNFTAEAVRRDGFGGAPRFEAWLAEVDGLAAGYALVVPAAYETGYAKAGVYLQDVFVAPEARHRGVGRALMAAVAADARTRGLDFVVGLALVEHGVTRVFPDAGHRGRARDRVCRIRRRVHRLADEGDSL
jgi:GNAT superfamily N-acetyltransferase